MLSFAWTAATSFSTVALRFSVFLGCLIALLGIEEAVRAIIEAVRGHVVPGWTSLMVVVCVIGSALLICLGIAGEYIGRIYEQSKARPLYLISQTLNGSRAGIGSDQSWARTSTRETSIGTRSSQ
jgi:dolichol-phosphate mannosyltransferase